MKITSKKMEGSSTPDPMTDTRNESSIRKTKTARNKNQSEM